MHPLRSHSFPLPSEGVAFIPSSCRPGPEAAISIGAIICRREGVTLKRKVVDCGKTLYRITCSARQARRRYLAPSYPQWRKVGVSAVVYAECAIPLKTTITVMS